MLNGKSVVCTLFENHYHLGLGAFVNSLHGVGFRGTVYAGYKGALPPWVENAAQHQGKDLNYQVCEGMHIYFAFQDTTEMLANIKPQLIQQVWDKYEGEVNNVFYFDCDIIVKSRWSQFEEWAKFGVAMVEDVNSPIAKTHPLRMQWKHYYAKFGIDYIPKDRIYVNGGFVGLNEEYKEFAQLWKELQDHMVKFTGKQNTIGIADRWNMFHYMDQDALNVAKDMTDKISVMGKDAMEFGKAGYVMSHAIGRIKPWQKWYLKNVLFPGSRPTQTDKIYWKYVTHPIRLYPERVVRRKRAAVKLATLLGRILTRT